MEFRSRTKEKVENLQKKADAAVNAIMGRPADPITASDAARIRQRVGSAIAWWLAGYWFQSATVLDGIRPLGLILFMAMGRNGAVWTLVGAIFSLILGTMSPNTSSISMADGVVWGVLLAMAMGARLLLSSKYMEDDGDTPVLFQEPLRLRVIVSLFIAFLGGVYHVLAHSFTYRGILTMLFTLTVTPILTALIWSAFQKDLSVSLRELGSCALIYCSIWVLSSQRLLGLSLAMVASVWVILDASLKGGLLRGGLLGLICGLASGVSPIILVLGGVVAGALRMFGSGAAVLCFVSVSAGLQIWQNGFWTAIPIIGNLLFGGLLYLPLAKTGLFTKLSLFPETAKPPAPTEEDRKAMEVARLRRLSASFEELSGMLLKFSRDMASPGAGELKELCQEAFRRHCKRCGKQEKCWQEDYESTNEAIGKLAEDIPRKGLPARGSLPLFFLERCRKVDDILAEISTEVAKLVEDTVLRDRTELFALDYQALSELLKDSAVDDGSMTPDEELRKIFAGVIRGEGIQTVGCGAWGGRKKTMVASGVTLATIPSGGRTLRGKLEEKTGLLLTDPSFRFVGETVSMQFESCQRLKLTTARANSVKENESVSGDTAKSFTSQIGYGYSLLCDGMGSGHSAATVAGIAAMFLEKLLSAGNNKAVTLKLLSNFIRGRAEECHTTVDLLEVDLYTGAAAFVKCGACPSYVLRDGNIYKIDVRSMPLGLTGEINAQQVSMVLHAGDVVLQVSDGVAGTLEEALWLPELFATMGGKSVQEIAGAIHSRTLTEKGKGDDITVLVTKIEGV